MGDSTAFEGLEATLQEGLKAILPEVLTNRVEVRVPSSDDLEHRLVRAP